MVKYGTYTNTLEIKPTIKDNSLQFWMIKIPKPWKHSRLGEIIYFFNQLHL